MNQIHLINEILEPYAQTPEGLPLWKTKNLILNYKNILQNIFLLSTDIASYFKIRHNNLVNQNIHKLFDEGQLSYHLLKIKQMIEVGKTAQRYQTIYALTRHQTYPMPIHTKLLVIISRP